jgi:2-polyprenyl-3-methyl-5-hydroxy-6-metoxy-1,4-benzoquinol methylase
MLEVRSDRKEILDEPGIPVKELERNLYELRIINKWLGGYNVSLNAIKKTARNGDLIVDIGCGGGDTLKEIAETDRTFRLAGVDLLAECIDYCQRNNPVQRIQFIQDDYRNIYRHFPGINVLHASLFCHHLHNDEIVSLIRLARQHKSVLVINDLERNFLAYWSIKFLTGIFSRSRLVKNDAPLSVSRGFRKKEWHDLLKRAGAIKYSVSNKWAFRHEVIVYE